MKFQKRILYFISEVNHQICQEIWLKPLKSEDLRSVQEKLEKKTLKKRDSKLRNFAHEVKIVICNLNTFKAGSKKLFLRLKPEYP